MIEYDLRQYPSYGVAEIHITNWPKVSHNVYRKCLVDLWKLREELRENGIRFLITYARDEKFCKLWSMFGFDDMGIDPNSGLFWGKMEIEDGN